MILQRFAVTQGWGISVFPKLRFQHYYLWLYLQGAFSHNPPLQVLEVHINSITGINIHITESKIHISYSENMIRHYYIIFTCHPFHPSPISLLRVVLFFISTPFDITKLQKKLSWCVIDWQLSIPNDNGNAYSYPLHPLWRWGLNLDLNDIKRVIIHLSVPENYGFDTIISVNIFTNRPSFMGARGAHKRHHWYNYSYHRVQN